MRGIVNTEHQQFQDYATRQHSLLVSTNTERARIKNDMKIHVILMCDVRVCVSIKNVECMMPYL